MASLSLNKNVWLSMFIIFIVTCGVFLSLFIFSEIFIVILVGLCLIFVTEKCCTVYRRLTSRLPREAGRAVAICIWCVFFAVILGVVFYCADRLNYVLMNITYFEQILRDGTLRLENLISEFVGIDAVSGILDRIVSAVSDGLFDAIGNILSHGAYFILCAVLLYPFMFYAYFHDSERIKKAIAGAVPEIFREGFEVASDAVSRDINNYVYAKVIESVVLAVVSCIGFYLIGLDNWLILGCLIGLLNNIPYIGPVIGTIPPMIVGITVSFKVMILAALVCLLGQVIDNIYLIPVVISKKVQVNSLLTVILVLAFSEAFGMLGMILAIPVYIICRIIFTESYKQLIRIFPSEETDDDGSGENENINENESNRTENRKEDDFDPVSFLKMKRDESRKNTLKF
ncbi:AI-2E family transporter [Methanosarcinaceae archaeon]|nr:AI-2E family transporter [Methanosarcinaceae archaeon]